MQQNHRYENNLEIHFGTMPFIDRKSLIFLFQYLIC